MGNLKVNFMGCKQSNEGINEPNTSNAAASTAAPAEPKREPAQVLENKKEPEALEVNLGASPARSEPGKMRQEETLLAVKPMEEEPEKEADAPAEAAPVEEKPAEQVAEAAPVEEKPAEQVVE